MKHIACSLLLILTLTASMLLPVSAVDKSSASQESVARTWRITTTAHILSNRDSELVVRLSNPERLRIEETDTVHAVQTLSLAGDIVWLDKNGGKLNSSYFHPGLEVKVTFRYTMWKPDATRQERYLKPKDCLQVRLTGDSYNQKSNVVAWELAPDEAIGVVMPGPWGDVDVFVEAGRTIENGAVFLCAGAGQSLKLATGAKIYGANGKAIQACALRPWQRVRVKLADTDFYDGSPGFQWTTAAEMRVLGDGEQMLRPYQLVRFGRVYAEVVGHEQDESGETRLLVEPISGTAEAGWQNQYIVAHSNMYATEHYEDFRVGDWVEIRYWAIRTGESRSRGVLSCDTGCVLPAPEEMAMEPIID